MAFINFSLFFLKKFGKIEKIGYHSNFNFDCDTERGFKESLPIALGFGLLLLLDMMRKSRMSTLMLILDMQKRERRWQMSHDKANLRFVIMTRL